MLFPFGNLNYQKFLGFINNNNNESKNSNSFLILKPPPDLALLFNQFNNTIPENNSDPENVIQSKYYDIGELEKSLSFFHINSYSLNKNFEELPNLLQSTNIQFDIIAIIVREILSRTSKKFVTRRNFQEMLLDILILTY